MNEVYLLTGGNMGDRLKYLQQAAKRIEERCGKIIRRSAIFETAAWGNTGQDAFLNQCLLLHTGLAAEQLLKQILSIENDLGRIRMEKYGPRTIDIDILFYNDEIINIPGLHIPHPQMQYRRFVLECIHDIAPGKKHPVVHKPVYQLLAECADTLAVHKFI
jgi:2-amino-4-hydroxy-6-hydroxymethyldihydropteridine diphosphokinase